jgi:phosphomannomutase
MPLIRSVSGLRATTGDGALSQEVVSRHVRAFAMMQPDGAIAVGYDGRLGGDELAELVIAELLRSGRDVLDLGCVPTPTVEVITERNGLAGGIVVTASHNGQEWNGLKFLDADGVFLLTDRATELWQLSDRELLPYAVTRGARTQHHDPIGEHIAAIGRVELVAKHRAEGALAGMRITIDAVNASGSRALPYLVEWLGAEPLPVNCDGSGIFPHPPEPLPEHLEELQRQTARRMATLGIAVDPDADRLVLVHSSGEPISEEKTIVLATEAVLQWTRGGTIVVNASTTSQVERVAAQYGASVLRSAVGEVNVVQMMKAHGAIVGGEGSGGVILPACHYGRDALVGTALVLVLRSTMTADQWDERTLASPLVMQKRKLQWHGRLAVLQPAVLQAFPDVAEIWTGDGIRLSWGDRWLHIRPSNTEPILRLIAESPSADQTAALLDCAEQLLARYAEHVA